MIQDATQGEPWKKYEKIGVLGQGGFGKVFLVQLTQSEAKKFALKSIPKKTFMRQPRLLSYFDTQKELMKTIISPHIVHLEESWVTEDAYELLMEYCPHGTLEQHITKNLKESISNKIPLYFVQMLLGMYALHRHNIIHRDLKLDNILVGQDEVVKLADFGIAKRVANMTKTSLGTPGAKAPEVYRGQPYTTKADIWSLGIILFQLFNDLKRPFDPVFSQEKDYYDNKIKKKFIISKEGISASGRDLLRKMLIENQTDRIGWLQIHSHPFIEQFVESVDNNEFQLELITKLCDAKIFYQQNQSDLQRLSNIQRKVRILYRDIYKFWTAGIHETSKKSFQMLLMLFLLTFKILQLYMEARHINKTKKQITEHMFTQLQYMELKSCHEDLYFQLNLVLMKNHQKNVKQSQQIFSDIYFKTLAVQLQDQILNGIENGKLVYKTLFYYIDQEM